MTPQELLAERRNYFPSHNHLEQDRTLIRLLLEACDPDDAMDAIVTAYHIPHDVRIATNIMRGIEARKEEEEARQHVLAR